MSQRKYCVVAAVAVLRQGRIIKDRTLDEVFGADILKEHLWAPWETRVGFYQGHGALKIRSGPRTSPV